MARYGEWHYDYWLLLMQVYLSKPTGVKPLYSRALVELSLELHIPPQVLRARMQQLSRLETPRIERLWRTYSKDAKRLERAVRLLRSMNGFGAAEQFYSGVEVQETFEKEFRTIEGTSFTPAMLAMVLHLYFQLTPQTMVAETPEVKSLAKTLHVDAAEVVHALDVFQACDPYLHRAGMVISPLLLPCQQVWHRFGNDDPSVLQAYVDELQEYFRQ